MAIFVPFCIVRGDVHKVIHSRARSDLKRETADCVFIVWGTEFDRIDDVLLSV